MHFSSSAAWVSKTGLKEICIRRWGKICYRHSSLSCAIKPLRLTCPEASKLVETLGWPNFNFVRINMVSGASNYNPTKRCTHHLREPLWRNFLLVEDLKGAITFHRRLENEEREREKVFKSQPTSSARNKTVSTFSGFFLANRHFKLISVSDFAVLRQKIIKWRNPVGRTFCFHLQKLRFKFGAKKLPTGKDLSGFKK